MQSSPKLTIFYGLLAAGIGLFYVLYAAGLFGATGRHGNDAPNWLGFVFGATFVLGGIAVVIKAVTAPDNLQANELPATTPRWLRSVYQLMALAIVGLLGVIASWVAFGPGERHFTGSGSFLGETAGRTVFGLGAVVIWVVIIAMLIATVRRLRALK
jgi:hypothetical protein